MSEVARWMRLVEDCFALTDMLLQTPAQPDWKNVMDQIRQIANYLGLEEELAFFLSLDDSSGRELLNSASNRLVALQATVRDKLGTSAQAGFALVWSLFASLYGNQYQKQPIDATLAYFKVKHDVALYLERTMSDIMKNQAKNALVGLVDVLILYLAYPSIQGREVEKTLLEKTQPPYTAYEDIRLETTILRERPEKVSD